MRRKCNRPDDASERDLYWLAGLLEGEGSFMRGSPSKPHLPSIQCAMIDQDVVARAAAIFGCGVTTVRPRRSHWKQSYAIRVRGAAAVEWMTALRPLLGTRRREQVDRAVATYENRSNQRLDDVAARQALELLADGSPVREVAERFDVTAWCIYDLRLGRTHKHIARPRVECDQRPRARRRNSATTTDRGRSAAVVAGDAAGGGAGLVGGAAGG